MSGRWNVTENICNLIRHVGSIVAGLIRIDLFKNAVQQASHACS